VLVCAEDPRCQAVLGMDTWIERVADDVIARGLTQPLLMVNSEAWTNGGNNYTTYLLAFFDKHLRGEAVGLLDGPSLAYPEVHFEKR